MLPDQVLMALNVYQEAGREVPAGKAAIARVVLNRMKHKFQSDGTIAGTVLHNAAFSWAWFSMVNGEYVRVADTLDEAVKRCEYLLAHDVPSSEYDRCDLIAQQVQNGEYADDVYAQLTDEVVYYYNPDIVKETPEWATDDKYVCTIGRHKFFAA